MTDTGSGTVRMSFTGDIICKKEMCDRAWNGRSYDFDETFREIRHLFSGSGIVIGNLETPVTDDRMELVSERRSFCAPREFAQAVYDAGIKCVSTANNHALDRGIEGLNKTLRILDDIGFIHTGTFLHQERKQEIIREKNLKIGMMSYTYGTNAHHNNVYLDESEEWHINLFQKQEFHNKILRYIFRKSESNVFFRYVDRAWCLLHPEYIGKAYGERRQPDKYELEMMRRDISEIKKEDPDILLMCMHIGGQFNAFPTSYSVEMSRRLKDLGVDIIVGNHEHRIQGVDLSDIENSRFIMYCLGNLISTTGILEKPFKKEADYSVICHIDVDTVSRMIKKISYNIIKIVQGGNGVIRAVPAFFLYKGADPREQEKLRSGIINAARRFSGDPDIDEAMDEYVLYSRK